MEFYTIVRVGKQIEVLGLILHPTVLLMVVRGPAALPCSGAALLTLDRRRLRDYLGVTRAIVSNGTAYLVNRVKEIYALCMYRREGRATALLRVSRA